MEHIITILTITGINTLGLMSPGPDFIMAVRNSLTYSRKTGIWTALGFSAGITVHIAYSLLGLAIIISQSIVLFNTIKYLGAGYLIYIGIKSLRSRSGIINIGEQEKKEDIPWYQAFKIGFLTNVLNPKASLFFMSLFTFAIAPETPNWVMAILVGIMILSTALWFSLVSIFFTQHHVQKVFNKFQGIFNKTFGGLLILLGLKVALAKK